MAEMAHLDHEQFRVIVLDIKNRIIANQVLYQGTISSAAIRIAEVFRSAVTRKAAHIIVCHNHPSGSIEPSPEDLSITSQMVEAGNLLDIEVLDHIIIGNHRFLSLKDRM